MRKLVLLFTLALALPTSVFSQISITDGRHTLEISGGIYGYYNYRFYPSDPKNYKKDNFSLRNAYIEFEGRIGRNIEYELQYNFAKTSLDDPENPPLMNAYGKYKGFKAADVTFGYTKVPYSRSSLVPFQYMPFIQRPTISKGDIYSRRDMGVMLSKSLMNQQLNYYFGIFTGLGEAFNSAIYGGDNDNSGKPEFIARVDYSWPSRFRYREIDVNHSAIPMFSLGVNGRYSNKQNAFVGDYSIKTVDGKRAAYGGDFSFQYRGFSLQAEGHQIVVTPRDPSTLIYSDKDPNTGQPVPQNWIGKETSFMAGGFLVSANYYSKALRSVFAVRYDRFNAK